MDPKDITIGINAAHDASACLLIDGAIELAIAEERLNRQKHFQGLPVLSIGKCLDILSDKHKYRIDKVVINQFPDTDFRYELALLFDKFEVGAWIRNPSHHLLHCLYAISICPAREAVIIVADGSGYSYSEYKRTASPMLNPAPEHHDYCESISTYLYEDGRLHSIDKQWGQWAENSEQYYRFPSLGHMYSVAAQHIFDSWHDAGKVMGLASFGNAEQIPEDIINCDGDRLIIDTDWILKIPKLRDRFQLEKNEIATSIAAKAQVELQKGMLYLAKNLWDRFQCPNLCISGGVGLNTVCNSYLKRNSHYRHIYVTPAAGDSGISIGAALYGYWTTEQKPFHFIGYSEFLGPAYSEGEILAAIGQVKGIRYARVAQPERLAAEEIRQDKIVGWFEGKSEFGPRALGHRSILSNPGNELTPLILNKRIKFRESFRPFAAAVLEEYEVEFFETYCASPHMMFVWQVKEEKRDEIPAAVHVDGSCRIQSVEADYPGRFRNLIEHFFKLSGIPMVINTSLNLKGMPMCETPLDALLCFMKSEIDVLYLESFRVEKVAPFSAESRKWKVRLSEDAKVSRSIYIEAGACKEAFFLEDRYTGRALTISSIEYQLLKEFGEGRHLDKIESPEEQQLITHFFNQGFLVYV